MSFDYIKMQGKNITPLSSNGTQVKKQTIPSDIQPRTQAATTAPLPSTNDVLAQFNVSYRTQGKTALEKKSDRELFRELYNPSSSDESQVEIKGELAKRGYVKSSIDGFPVRYGDLPQDKLIEELTAILKKNNIGSIREYKRIGASIPAVERIEIALNNLAEEQNMVTNMEYERLDGNYDEYSRIKHSLSERGYVRSSVDGKPIKYTHHSNERLMEEQLKAAQKNGYETLADYYVGGGSIATVDIIDQILAQREDREVYTN